jgi:voltage-gated potassium channel Kch
VLFFLKNFGTIPPGQTGTEQLNWLDSLYFSVVTWTTLGYGDFRPGTDTVKLFVMTEALLGYVYMGMLIGKILLLGQSKKSQ